MCNTLPSSSSPFPTTPPFPTPRFSLLPPPRPDPFSLPFKTHVPKRPLSIRVGSSRPGASLNDVTSASTLALSFYELLGIPETGSLGEIKHAYKQLARKYHPDMSPPGLVDEYTRKFIRVQEAYETLSDPGLRAMYDQDMAKGLHFAFSARKAYNNHQRMEDRQEWKSRWQSQLSELKRRSMYKETSGSMSWGERVRRQRNESSF